MKRKDVLEYVLYHLLAETDYYELDEPQACVALLDEFREVNDPVRQFLGDVLPVRVRGLVRTVPLGSGGSDSDNET